MSVIYILIGVSIAVASLFLGAFIWAVKSGQFEDSYTPSVRMLFDSDKPTDKKEEKQSKEKDNGNRKL